jgi:hypothetical protein
LDVAAWALSAALYAAFGYIFFAVLPITMPGLGLVRFWPQVVIPAVFAVIFGPWVGGLGAAVGIFISDMLIHGNPILSLMAGVPSNFVMFWLIGYFTKKKIKWKLPALALGIISLLLVVLSYTYLTLGTAPIYSGIIIVSYVLLLIFLWLTPKWRSYEVGSTIGLLIGSAIIGTMVPLFSQFFIMPGKAAITPLALAAGFSYLIWTFSTEIPFLLVLGPPILEAVHKAYPSFKPKNDKREPQ